ncbi:putative membrane protein [Campylobacter phage vB_CjeM_WX1]|nr:putative membrane protein [Campylobacter phage vB_CjeM_WX1]
MGIIKSTARGIRGTYSAGKNAVNSVNSAYNNAVSSINKVNSALDPMNAVRSATQRLNNWMDSGSKVSKTTQKNNDTIVNELNGVGNEVISAAKALDPMNARKLTEISESLKNLSKQISDIKKGLIDNQDTEIRHQGFDKKVQNVSESKVNTPQNKSFFDKLLGWLGGLLGISAGALLPLLGSLGSFLTKPLDFILDLLKGGINKLWTLFEPLLGPIIDPLKNGFEFLKNKWNSLVDFINKKINIGDKWKISDNDNPKNPKSPKVSSSNPAKEQSWLSKKWDSFKGAVQNGYDWSSRKIDDLKSYASKKYQDIKNSKVGKIVSAGYDKLKAAQKYIVEKAIEGFDAVKNIVSSAWDSAVKAAQKGFNMLKKFVLAPIEKFVSSVGKKLFGSSKLFSILPSILGNLEKIGARLAASGAKIASKALPGVGFAVGIYQAWDFFTRGRWVLGSIAALSACISLLPGIGGIISMCLDLGLFAADIITSPEDVDNLNKEQNDLVNTANKMVQNNDTGGISEPSQAEKDKAQSGVQDLSSSSGAKGLNAKVLDGKSANDFAALYTPHKVDSNGTVIAAKTGSIYKGLTWEESEKYDAEKQAYFKKREEKQAQLDALFEQGQKAMDSGDTETFNKLVTQRDKLSDTLSSMSLDSINTKYETMGQARIKKLQSQGANADLSVFRTNADSVTSSGGTDTKPDSTNASASVASQASGSISPTQTTQTQVAQGSSSGGSPGSKAAAEFSKKYNLGTRSTGSCAKYVRSYLMAAGYPLSGWPVAAADYINFLPKYGFTPVQGRATQISPEVGDISITQRFGNHKYGHIAIWNGSNWISDFKQNSVSIYRDVNAFGGPDANITILRDTSGQNPSQELVNQQLSNMDRSFKVALGGGGAKGAVYSLASGVSNMVTNTAGAAASVISSGVGSVQSFANTNSTTTRKSLAQMYTESGLSTSFGTSSVPKAASSAPSSTPKETKADIKPASKPVSPTPKAVNHGTPHRGQYDTETITDFSNLGDNFIKSKSPISLPGDSKPAGSVSSNVQTNNASPVTPVVIAKNTSASSDYSWASKNSFKIARMFGLDGISDYEILNEGTESDFLQSYSMSKRQAIQSAGLNNTVQTKVASNVKTKDVIPAVNKTQINNTNIQTKTKETSNKDLTDSFVLS